MRNSAINLLKTSALALLLTAPAAADFVYTGPSQGTVKSSLLFERTILDATKYRADQMPMGIVLEMIAGEHVAVDFGQDLNKDDLVSFRGGRPRREILNEVLTPRGYTWQFRDNKLMVRSSRELQLSDQIYGQIPAEDRYMRPVTWKVPKGITLKQLIHEWAARARMTVDWDVETPITIGAPAKFDGELIPVIETMLESLGDEVPMIMVDYNTINTTLRVWEYDGVN